MMKRKRDKTPFSCMWQMRLFGKDWLFGYINIQEVAEVGEYADPNEILKKQLDDPMPSPNREGGE